jgi:hypothetical protein
MRNKHAGLIEVRTVRFPPFRRRTPGTAQIHTPWRAAPGHGGSCGDWFALRAWEDDGGGPRPGIGAASSERRHKELT